MWAVVKSTTIRRKIAKLGRIEAMHEVAFVFASNYDLTSSVYVMMRPTEEPRWSARAEHTIIYGILISIQTAIIYLIN